MDHGQAGQQQQQQQQQQYHFQFGGQQLHHSQNNRSFDMQSNAGLRTPQGSPSFLPILASGPPNAIPIATSSSSAFASSSNGPSSWQQQQMQLHMQQQQQQQQQASTSTSNSKPQGRDRQESVSYHGMSQDTPYSASSGQQQAGSLGDGPYASNNMGSSNSQVTALVAGSQGNKNSKRAIQSCAECKRRKIKCDRIYPCSPCKLRGEESLCREVEKLEPIHMPVPTMMDFEAACARISQLEDMMTTMQKLVTLQGQTTQQLQLAYQSQQQGRIAGGGNGEPSSPRNLLGFKPLPAITTTTNSSRNGSPALFDDRKFPAPPSRNFEDVTKSGERDHEDMAMMLEDFAMNNRQNREKAAKLMGAPDGTAAPMDAALPSPVRGVNGSVSDPMSALTNFINPQEVTSSQAPSSTVEFVHPLAGVTNPSTDYIAKFFSQAPDAVRGWQLVQFYFTHLEWYSRVLHGPTFLQECRNLLSLPFNQISSSRVRPAFLAQYFMVLCLALQFIEEQDRSNLGLTADEAQTYCTNMFTAVQGLLNLCDYMGHHSLEHLQIIALMGVYQYNVGQADSHWALLGSAIKIAQNIGMSRLGSEKADMKWPEAWQNPLKREIGRRVWWNMIFLDWSLATAHNACYSIHPSQNFTDYPANVDDEDLQDNKPVVARPLDQHTDTSFTICRLKFVALYRELVDHTISHPTPSYTFILEMDTRIVNLLDTLPPYFRGATPPADHINDSKVMECLLIQLIGETRLLRLHRPYLSRGYRDRKYAPSKERCVNSARSILVLLKTAEKASPILLGQWLTLFYGFGAAVVTFIDLCHGKGTDDEESTRQKRQHVSEMIAVLKSAKHVSDAARRATQLLEGLLAAEEDCPAWPNNFSSSNIGQKRKLESLDDPDPFRRTVKKLLLDASTKGGSTGLPSPGSSSGLPQQSPTIFSQSGLQENRSIPTFSSGYGNQPVRPPPFLPDLDLFMESSGKYAHFSKPTPVFANEEPVDSTTADLSHLFVDDILSNLFTTDPLGGQEMGFGGSGW